MKHLPLFSNEFLFSLFEDEYNAFKKSGKEAQLSERLQNWAERRATLTETQLESQFVKLFFQEIWGYWGTGEKKQEEGYCLSSRYGVSGAGPTGGKGAADLALGWWNLPPILEAPQVLAEFKDIRASLDAPQPREGNNRSPVKQCFDYLKYAFDATPSQSVIVPTWGIVTNMNEFRLYCRKEGEELSQRFIIHLNNAGETDMLGEDEASSRQRFLFWKLFQPDMLLTKLGKSPLAKLLDEQIVRERELEKEFYREYQAYRLHVYQALVDANPHFSGTHGRLVKLTQRFLDRCLFIMFCEDMGKALNFPTNLLSNLLRHESTSSNYSEEGENIWSLVKQLFRTMRSGGVFPINQRIDRFNGGLFAEYPELENLVIPNRIFCTINQGLSEENIKNHKKTLLYLSATYNYGVRGSARERTITLYALGRIFEQSITELEYMEAEAEGEESLAGLSKRKRDGVYYTPEWVTGYIVQETIGVRLEEIRSKIGLVLGEEISQKDLADYNQYKTKKRKPKTLPKLVLRMQQLDTYEAALEDLKVLDASCGSGAFLIQSLRFLLQERQTIAEERKRMIGGKWVFDMDTEIRSILSRNLYGVDINPESVEITQLALWLHTAVPGKPLSNLDEHIRCGNSLVGPEFQVYFDKKNPKMLFADMDEQKQEDINVFDWQEAFPEVFSDSVSENKRGFDCIVGNPPYVKLQHFRKLKPDESDFFLEQQSSGGPLFESTQTGNYDMYLPFIEKCLSLLNSEGQLGMIAPNVWLKNEYGQGLRQKIKRMKALNRWIDFKSFQVFEEVTTYTALQFFSRQPCEDIRFFLNPNKNVEVLDWRGVVESTPYQELHDEDAWNLIYKKDKDLIERLGETCLRLDDPSLTKQIFQGLITSKDLVYHLKRLSPGKYAQIGGKADGIVYEIEDEIMHPLVSGPETKRYLTPKTDTYLLFPYIVDKMGARLLSEKEMAKRFPKAWAYLKKFETMLRKRESNFFDDEQWYRFGRNQSIDKQELTKLGVAETVPGMRVFADNKGEFYFNNVRVNGILPKHETDLWYLLGVLNSPLVNYVFKLIAKPKDGGYFEANKQFIAPLPIPKATKVQRAEVGKMAKKLQHLHSLRCEKIIRLGECLAHAQCMDDRRQPNWLWAEVKTVADWKVCAPKELSPREKCAWAKTKYAELLETHYEQIDELLSPKAPLQVDVCGGELSFFSGAYKLVSVFLDEVEMPFIAAQWHHIAYSTNVTESFKAKKLVDTLLSLRGTNEVALRKKIVGLDNEIETLSHEIVVAEREINKLTYQLYGLSEAEIKLVENKRHG